MERVTTSEGPGSSEILVARRETQQGEMTPPPLTPPPPRPTFLLLFCSRAKPKQEHHRKPFLLSNLGGGSGWESWNETGHQLLIVGIGWWVHEGSSILPVCLCRFSASNPLAMWPGADPIRALGHHFLLSGLTSSVTEETELDAEEPRVKACPRSHILSGTVFTERSLSSKRWERGEEKQTETLPDVFPAGWRGRGGGMGII